jgi:exodeoxyribonuclease VII small subunit
MTRKAVPPAATTTAPASQDAPGPDQIQGQPAAQAPSFEDQLAELEALVDTLERGDLSLEQSLAAFERGILLTRTCQQALDTAEQKVRILTSTAEDAQPEPFVHE